MRKSYKSGEIINFGKHKGDTIDHVCQFDPTYVDWMYQAGICDEETVADRDEGNFKHKKLSRGDATVWTWN
jgi:hypothetical protein